MSSLPGISDAGTFADGGKILMCRCCWICKTAATNFSLNPIGKTSGEIMGTFPCERGSSQSGELGETGESDEMG